MTAISPVERQCADCQGTGCRIDDPWQTCPACKRLGRVWRPGAPLYGCNMTLEDRNPGEIVTLGNGDRGRIVAHRGFRVARGKRHYTGETPTTMIALIGEFSGVESKTATSYPSCVGVVSVSDPRWFYDSDSHADDREDATDPMRRKTP
jgi:hypothetical protein